MSTQPCPDCKVVEGYEGHGKYSYGISLCDFHAAAHNTALERDRLNIDNNQFSHINEALSRQLLATIEERDRLTQLVSDLHILVLKARGERELCEKLASAAVEGKAAAEHRVAALCEERDRLRALVDTMLEAAI